MFTTGTPTCSVPCCIEVPARGIECELAGPLEQVLDVSQCRTESASLGARHSAVVAGAGAGGTGRQRGVLVSTPKRMFTIQLPVKAYHNAYDNKYTP